MTSKAKPIPDGYETPTPYLCCKDAAGAIEFYKTAFGATELMRLADPSGKVGHAEIKIGKGAIMLADECPEMSWRSPQSVGGTPVGIHVYVEDVDALASRAVGAGAKLVQPVKDQFYGDRTCKLVDPFGHVWFFATHKEDLSPEEIGKRAEALFGQK